MIFLQVLKSKKFYPKKRSISFIFLFLKDKTKTNTYWVNSNACSNGCVIDGYKYLYLQESNYNVAKNCFMSREQSSGNSRSSYYISRKVLT